MSKPKEGLKVIPLIFLMFNVCLQCSAQGERLDQELELVDCIFLFIFRLVLCLFA